MKQSEKAMCDRSLEFIDDVFKAYLENRNFEPLLMALHKNVTWFGTECVDVCKNIENVVMLIQAKYPVWNTHCKVTNHNFNVLPVSDKYAFVCGDFTYYDENDTAALSRVVVRMTVLCGDFDGIIKISHVHFSTHSSEESNDEFTHQTLVENYNVILEEKLVEHTKMLKDKTNALETLANNIYGGVIICDIDDDYTISYASKGFFPMIGYTKKDLANNLKNKLSNLMFENEIANLRNEIDEQLAVGNTFCVEYKIRRKDGNTIFVLDKGVVIKNKANKRQIQSIITDITQQKTVETNLRISEKRYEIALKASEVSMFEYNVLTKDLILFGNIAEMYGISSVVANGPQTFVEQHIISSENADDYFEMYRQIHAGAPEASCYVTSTDIHGKRHEFLLYLTNLFDENGTPIRAIGVRKNVTEQRQLQKEKDYIKTMASEQHLIYEANVTRDTVINVDDEWAESVGVVGITSFEALKKAVGKKIISGEFHNQMRDKISAKYITSAYERGQKLITLEYKRKVSKNEYRWYKKVINIIKDSITHDIYIRCYISDIHNKKIKELKQVDDRKLYEAMIAKTDIIYEINITKDLFICGHENWFEMFSVEPTDNYTEMIENMSHKSIHPDDAHGFMDIFNRKIILEKYAKGQDKIVLEYRRPDKSGVFIWVRCSLHLYEDLVSGDIKGHSYIENIHDEKCKEIQLIYNAEHDYLTTLLNKSATEKYIANFLESKEGKSGMHAYFIIDLDYFKAINDNFGHAFGDAVLSRIATNLKDLFRDVDVLGRVGGDEFVVLMKNISNIKIANNKAREICEKLFDSFNKDNNVYTVSTSIGIALYPSHGKTYKELYNNSDTALYVSKEKGRNRHTTYNPQMTPMVSNSNEIDTHDLFEPKVFESNIVEYVFKVLYENPDKYSAIDSVLELIGKQYNVSRSYIFEYSEDGVFASNTFEWCNTNITSQKENLQNISNARADNYPARFDKDGVLLLQNINNMNDGLKDLLEQQKIISILQFGIYKDGKFTGFVGFDECEFPWEPTKREISDLQSISHILSVFLLEMRSVNKINEMKNISMSIIHALDSYAYVCDPDTYQILFANTRTEELIPNIKIGSICHKTIRNLDHPCPNCPMAEMIKRGVDKFSMDVHNIYIGIHVDATSSWINWVDGKKACLINSVDTTRFY